MRVEHFSKLPTESVPFVTARNALLIGNEPRSVSLRFDVETRWTRLVHEDYGVWTTDLPCEQLQQLEACDGLTGHVLIGGLGLGLIARLLCRRPSVTRITIVEKDHDVIKLVSRYIAHRKIEVVWQDLFAYLRSAHTHDAAFLDIWQRDGELELTDTVYPLRRLARESCKLPDHRIRCWNEDVMRGQVRTGLETMLLMRSVVGDPDPKRVPNHILPFVKMYDGRWDEAGPRMLSEAAVRYADEFGTEAWEREWGVSSPWQVATQTSQRRVKMQIRGY